MSRKQLPRARAFSRGFTLIEVLVALAIVAVTLGAGIRAAGALTQNAQRAEDVMAAQWCAENRLTDLKLKQAARNAPPPVGDTDFSCTQMNVTYSGKLIVRPTPNPNFRRADAQVFGPNGQPLLRLSTVIS